MSVFKKVEGQGEDVVLIHGWGCDHSHMQPIADMLSSHYRVTNIDLPGRSRSDWESHIKNIHDIADVVLPVLPKKAIYIGWSFGGLVSMSIAARHPERVTRFIGLGSSPKFIADHNWPGVPQPGFKAFFDVNDLEQVQGVFKEFYEAEFSDFIEKPKRYYELFDWLRDTPIDLKVLGQGLNIVDAADLRKEFSTMNCPIDFVWGGRDGSLPVESHALIQQLNARAKAHVMPEAHHMMFWAHPEEFQKILNQILKGD